MKTLLRLALLLALVPLPLARAQTAAKPATAPKLTLSELGDVIDESLRWLRGHQDLASGSYGGVLETATALEAFTTSPRAYRASEGPFISKAIAFLLAKQAESGA